MLQIEVKSIKYKYEKLIEVLCGKVMQMATQIQIRRARDKNGKMIHWLLEYSFGDDVWYKINDKKVQPHPFLRRNLPEMKKYREAMNRIGQGETWLFDAVKVDDIIYITRVHGPSPSPFSPFEKMEENLRRLKNQPVEVFI